MNNQHWRRNLRVCNHVEVSWNGCKYRNPWKLLMTHWHKNESRKCMHFRLRSLFWHCILFHSMNFETCYNIFRNALSQAKWNRLTKEIILTKQQVNDVISRIFEIFFFCHPMANISFGDESFPKMEGNTGLNINI